MYSDQDMEPRTPRDVSTPGVFKILDNGEPSAKLTKPFDALTALTSGAPFWIAGGALTSIFTDDKVNDWDLFSFNPPHLISGLLKSGAKIVFDNSHVTNFKHDSIDQIIQVIKTPFETPLITCQTIDLTICAIAYDGLKLYVHEDFIDDIEQNKIGLNCVLHPFSTLKRVIKYSQRGYDLHRDVLVTLVDMIRHSRVDVMDETLFYLEDPADRKVDERD